MTNSRTSPVPSRAPSPARKGGGYIAIYFLGVGVFLLRLAIGTIRANRLTSASCVVPVTVGLLHPRIILPECSRDWPQAQLDAVLAHEGEHIRRRDPLFQWIALLNRAIFWFHPLAWWLERKLSGLGGRSLRCSRDCARLRCSRVFRIPARLGAVRSARRYAHRRCRHGDAGDRTEAPHPAGCSAVFPCRGFRVRAWHVPSRCAPARPRSSPRARSVQAQSGQPKTEPGRNSKWRRSRPSDPADSVWRSDVHARRRTVYSETATVKMLVRDLRTTCESTRSQEGRLD